MYTYPSIDVSICTHIHRSMYLYIYVRVLHIRSLVLSRALSLPLSLPLVRSLPISRHPLETTRASPQWHLPEA